MATIPSRSRRSAAANRSRPRPSTARMRDSTVLVVMARIDGEPCLDLCYEEDVKAEVDMNVVCTGTAEFVEVQGTGEAGVFTREQNDRLLDLAVAGCAELTELQRKALEGHLDNLLARGQLASPIPVNRQLIANVRHLETQNPIAIRIQRCVTANALQIFRMLTAIHLDHEPALAAHEIGDVRLDRLLPHEFKTTQPPVA